MSVLPFPPRGSWAWDARGHERAVRVSAHPRESLVNLSVWRDDLCVGTVRLAPAEVAGLIEGLTQSLARLAEQPATTAASAPAEEKLHEIEERLSELEARLSPPPWRAAATVAARRARAVLGRTRPRSRSGTPDCAGRSPQPGGAYASWSG
jgi:hypothetical protein